MKGRWRAAAAAAGAGLALAWLWGGPPAGPAPAEAPARLDGPAPTAQPRWADPVARAAPRPPAAGAQAATEPAAAVFDLCGLGRFSVPAGGAPDAAAGGLDALPAPLGHDALAQARSAMLATLRAGPPRARVAAALLSPPPVDDPGAGAAWAQVVLADAQASQDPVVLAWAEEACAHLPDGPACRLALIHARLRLEPDNAHHWAALADEDPSAAAEAWVGLQQAQRWHEQPQALWHTAQAALPPALPGYLLLALGGEIATRAATLPAPGEGFVVERCRGAAPPEGCQALAQVLAGHSDSVPLLARGAGLARALAWPAPAQHALEHALQRQLRQAVWTPEARQPLSCASVDAWQRHAVR